MKRVIACMIIMVFFSGAFAMQPNDTINPKSFNTTLFEKLIFSKVNEYRSENGLKRLRQDSGIYKVAKDQTDFLKKEKQLTHNQPSAGKATLQNRMEYYLELNGYAAGENLARTFILKPAYNYDRSGKKSASIASTYTEAAEYMLNAWKQSSFHNMNMLRDQYEISAIAAYFNPKDNTLTATQVFARIDD